jgi:cephalosporin hydroxylase
MDIKTALSGLFSRIRSNLSFTDPVVNVQCSGFEVNNWTISRFVVRKLVPIVDVQPFPLNEQMLMVAAVCRSRPTHIFEWGTHVGKSARIFFEICKAFGIDAEIHSIDLPDDVGHVEHPGQKRGSFVKGLKKVVLHQGDGLETSLRIAAECSLSTFRPLFLIDGDHSYESVKRELEGIIKNIPQAWILLHDTFNQSEGSGYNTGPYRAVNDVLAVTEEKYRIISQDLGLPGMILLWRPE